MGQGGSCVDLLEAPPSDPAKLPDLDTLKNQIAHFASLRGFLSATLMCCVLCSMNEQEQTPVFYLNSVTNTV